ncbi:MAG: hypothetical protein ACOVOD_01175 [Rhodoferax sp.]
MSVLFHAELSEREYSSHLLKVADLLAWAQSNQLSIKASPSIEQFEFVQVEAFLCAIEREVSKTITPEQALEIVANDTALSTHRAASDPITSRWLLSADAHREWRALLDKAIAMGELTLLRFGSKLPIAAPASAAGHAEENRGDSTSIFRDMQSLNASELNLAFVGEKSESGLGANNMLEVSARGITRRIPLAALDLVDKGKGTPNGECGVLLGLAKGSKIPKSPANSST